MSLLQVPEGFEAATAALFDGELTAPLLSDNQAAAAGCVSGWVELPPLAAPAALPEGVHPLAGEIGAPAALGRRLRQAGWVDSEDVGWQLQPMLQPGQSLVDRDGRLWRWDGFTRLAAGSSTTAEQLRQRNRLTVLRGEVEAATAVSAETVSLITSTSRVQEWLRRRWRNALGRIRQAIGARRILLSPK